MTDKEPENRSSASVEHAMNQVLQAERAAEQAVEACARDAVKIRQAAQERASHIARRTNERLATCHVRCNGKLSRELREFERTAAARQPGESTYRLDETALTSVVEALALALTGVIPAGNPTRDR
ncbi:MAG: hypothetical protein WBQ78_01355 [Gammaproteobacteria bacterium]